MNNPKEERLQKALARAGIASRRACEELIEAGRVKVNNKIVTELGTKIDPTRDKILVDDHPVAVKPSESPQKLYLLLNKPPGYLSTVSDPQGRPTVLDLVEVEGRLFPVGRLDADTTGLLLLSNDGSFAQALSHPRFGVEKEYLALLDGRPPLRDLDRLRKGVAIPVENPQTGEVEQQVTSPARVEMVGYEGSNTLVRFVIKEGKKRQIRLMARAIDQEVLELKRVRFGPLPLGELAEGQSRNLSKIEIKNLLQAANGERTAPTPRPGHSKTTAPVSAGSAAQGQRNFNRSEPARPAAAKFARTTPAKPGRGRPAQAPARTETAESFKAGRGRPTRGPDQRPVQEPGRRFAQEPARAEITENTRPGWSRNTPPGPNQAGLTRPVREQVFRQGQTRPNRDEGSRAPGQRRDEYPSAGPGRSQRGNSGQTSRPSQGSARGPAPDRERGAAPRPFQTARPGRERGPAPDRTPDWATRDSAVPAPRPDNRRQTASGQERRLRPPVSNADNYDSELD